jgi:membrane peptidoglycan carboxypeptidase
MVGYARALATAVWLGTTDGKALVTKSGATNVFGSTYAGPIWRQFMAEATSAMQLDTAKARFDKPATPTPSAESTVEPTPTATAEPEPDPTKTPVPTVPPTVVPSVVPSISKSPLIPPPPP